VLIAACVAVAARMTTHGHRRARATSALVAAAAIGGYLVTAF
jgi:hypothetical protein